jgi:predicted AlkP superfamily phosphohydrolase/phosphomutase
MMKNRVVLFGIDGVSYSVMDKLSDDGIMPNFKKLKPEGEFKVMQSSIPANSAVSWSTIITGKNPAEHGIFGFSDMMENSYTMRFPNFLNLKTPTFWDGDGTYVIINVPMTYPVREMNGCHISGFISLELEKAIYPKDLYEELKDMGYKVDVDSEKGHKSKKLLIDDLNKVLEKRVESYRHLWGKYDWDVFMFVITGSDRIE